MWTAVGSVGWRFGQAFLSTDPHVACAHRIYGLLEDYRNRIRAARGAKWKIMTISILSLQIPTQRGLARFSRYRHGAMAGRLKLSSSFFLLVQQVPPSCTDAFRFVVAGPVPVYALDSTSSLLRDDLLTRTLTRFHFVFATWIFLEHGELCVHRHVTLCVPYTGYVQMSGGLKALSSGALNKEWSTVRSAIRIIAETFLLGFGVYRILEFSR